MSTIRAVYRDGALYPLEPVPFKDGETLQLTVTSITSMDEIDAALRDALGDLVTFPTQANDESADDAMQRQIDATVSGVTLSDAVRDERRESP